MKPEKILNTEQYSDTMAELSESQWRALSKLACSEYRNARILRIPIQTLISLENRGLIVRKLKSDGTPSRYFWRKIYIVWGYGNDKSENQIEI